MPVTFATVDEGDIGYDGVRFEFVVTSAPEGANVTFSSADGQVSDLVLGINDKGYWGGQEKGLMSLRTMKQPQAGY